MIRSLNYISKLFLLVFCLNGSLSYGQDIQKDSTTVSVDSLVVNSLSDQVEIDTSKVTPPFFSGLSIVLDYGKLVTYWTNFERKAEVGLLLNIKGPFSVSGEFGAGTLTPQNAYTNADYKSVGSYYRVGVGYTLAINQQSNLSLGVKYANGKYEDEGVVRVTSSSGLFDDLESPFQRTGLSAQWYEVVLGTESLLKPRLYLGAYLRLRVMMNYDQQVPIDTYAIPGYGRTFDDTVPALNFYLRYQLFGARQ